MIFAVSGFIGTSANAQYCTPPESMSGGPMTGFENVSLGTLNNNSVDDGYTDYTGSVATVNLAKGSSYTPSFRLYHQILNSGFSDQVDIRIWIDYNIDGDFDDVGEQVFSAVPPELMMANGNNYTGTAFIIPAGATLGVTRMRVYCDMLVSDGHDTPIPCGYLTSGNANGQHGECEDYSVTITAAAAGVEDLSLVEKFSIYSNNQGNVVVNYNLNQQADVVVELYDIAGQMVSTVVSQNQITGQYTFLIDGTEFSKGIYFVSMKVDDKVYSKKVVL